LDKWPNLSPIFQKPLDPKANLREFQNGIRLSTPRHVLQKVKKGLILEQIFPYQNFWEGTH
jgi:hypothetical protein